MRRRQFIQQHLSGNPILDIGNIQWEGATHTWLMSILPDSKFYGLDLVDQASVGLSFENQFVGSCTALPFADNFFGGIYAGQVLEHIWDPKAMVDECYRTLKPGGVLVLDTPHIYSLSRMLRFIVTGKDVILGNPEHKFFFSYAMLENLLKQAGFKDVNIRMDDSFAFKSKLYRLPDIWPFRHLGECLMVSAIK